jgi:hypothetical protein
MPANYLSVLVLIVILSVLILKDLIVVETAKVKTK